MNQQAKKPTADLRHQRVSKALSRIMDQIPSFVTRLFGTDALHEAWEEWDALGGSWFEQSPTERGVFLAWVFFGWDPATVGFDGPVTVAEYFLEELGHLSSKLELEYIRAGLETSFSFFLVHATIEGVGLHVEDILTKQAFFVHEVSGSRSVSPKCILFGKAIPVDGIYVFDGIREHILGVNHLPEIVNFRHQCLKILDQTPDDKLESDALIDFDDLMRALFVKCREMDLNPTKPEMQNTDGEKMDFVVLHYTHNDLLTVFDKLADLSVMSSKEEILEGAERKADGVIESLTFDWVKKGNKMHKSWTNTVLGHLVLKPKTLTVDVNSKERAERIQSLIQEKCGNLVVFQKKGPPLQEVGSTLPEGPLDPVIEAAKVEMLTGMYKDWLKKKIPALGLQTPLQAVKTPEGREMVDALLIDMEPAIERMLEGAAGNVIKMLRQKLGFIPKK